MINVRVSTPSEQCALCFSAAPLQKSHLLPSALYKMVRGDGKNPHPMQINREGWRQSCAQDQAYLLCYECEQRMHRQGENWVLRNLRRGEQQFGLRETILRQCTQSTARGEHSIYQLPRTSDVNFDALAYFAASVIWKAAAYPWRRGKEIDLGVYSDAFRRYLLGETVFPDEAIVLVDVTAEANRLKPVVSDPITTRDGRCHRHWFFTPGVIFEITVGRRIPSGIRRLCALRNRIIVSSNHETTFQQTYAAMMNG